MQIRHIKNLQQSQPGIARVTAICWSPNGKKLAVADYARSVHLYDDGGERRDRFNTKPSDPTRSARTYVIRGMMFSPDSTKLAIAQSDSMVFVYKLGVEWNEKKSICGKFSQSGPVTCMCWPQSRNSEICVFGTAEGKVKVATLKTNKTQTLFPTESYVVSIASAQDGTVVISGHLDGTIYRYAFEEATQYAQGLTKLAQHTTVPYCLSWGEHVSASGNDCKIVFYDKERGTIAQSIDLNPLEDKDVTVCEMSPSGSTLLAGTWNRIRLYNYNTRSRKWEESSSRRFENLHSITAAGWKSDGSKIVIGSLCGAVDVYEACLRRVRYKSAFEFTYVSQNQVIVRRIATGTRIVLKSMYGHEIQKVNVHHDRYLVANTAVTILLGDLTTCKLSEIQWQVGGIKRMFFDNPQVCMLFQGGELCLVEYGRNEVLGTCRTDYVKPHLISVRIVGEAGTTPDAEDKRRKIIAYLIDKHTIQLDDLVSGISVGRIAHSNRVEWLELNAKATKLLYRDKQKQLYLLDIATQVSSTLLTFCTFVQWVPGSDVVVAQNRGDLCVWYSIDAPDRVAVVPIKGDVEGIERANGKTEVIVDEGVNTCAYGLDEVLIEFGTAMEDGDYDRACDLLDQIPLTPETETMWQRLSQQSLSDLRLTIAERCFAALGDVAKSRAIAQINKMAQDASAVGFGATNGYDHYDVRAQMCILSKEFKRAEQIYLEHGQIEKAMDMWRELYRMDECVSLAEAKQHPRTAEIRAEYFTWLMDTKQEGAAAELKEKEKRFHDAINLYLQGGMPARAAQVVSTNQLRLETVVLESIASALFKAGIFEKAGEFFENLGLSERAIDAYKKGQSFRRAVELSRKAAPAYVVTLEEEWGDYLVHQKKVDVAVNHYIEAHQYGKAIEAAISARQWTKAVTILEQQGSSDHDQTKKFYKQIAIHFEGSSNYADAEKYFVKAGSIADAVGMYTRRGQWENGTRVASKYLSQQELVQMYIEQAQQLEAVGDFSRAEHLLLKVGEIDTAISMYKKSRDFTSVIRLVTEYRHEWLLKTHLALAQQLERECNYKLSEHHYVQAKEWAKAVNMYREHNQWDDSIRVAKVHGGAAAAKQVIMSRAMSIEAEEGVKILIKYNMTDVGIEYAIENQQFEKALEWAHLCMTSKVSYVYLKYAMYLEDEGKYALAEDSFIRANRPKEAIDMYIHQHDWVAAMNVADTHDPTATLDILIAQAREAFGKGDYINAESLLLRAQSPELLVKMFKEAKMYKEALRVAKEHCPQRVAEISRGMANDCADPLQASAMLDSIGDYNQAINAYLRCGKEHTSNIDSLKEGYQRALVLCRQHVRERAPEVLTSVVQKLIALDAFDQAAKCLEDAKDFKGAVDVYINSQQWEKAAALAQSVSRDMSDYVKKSKIKTLVDDDAGGDALVTMDKDAAVESYIRSKDFEKALKVSQGLGEKSEEVRKSVAGQYIQHLVKDRRVEEALSVVAREGMEVNDFRFYKVYESLASLTVSMMSPSFDTKPLHDGMVKLVDHMRKTGQPDADVARMDSLTSIIHIYTYVKIMRANGMPELAAKLGLSLIRHCDVMPCDRAFLDAGNAARVVGNMNSIAFVFLNRYLDICDNIEEGSADSAALDDSDFMVCADLPKTFPLPKSHTIPAKGSEGEDARQWVLTMSLNPKLEQTLPCVKCPKCSKFMFEGSSKCPSNHALDVCCITGYPIFPGVAKVKCRTCSRSANQTDWNKYVMAVKSCPWCLTPQSATFGN